MKLGVNIMRLEAASSHTFDFLRISKFNINMGDARTCKVGVAAVPRNLGT
jgi:hypothetical protein